MARLPRSLSILLTAWPGSTLAIYTLLIASAMSPMYRDLLYVVKGNASCDKCWLRGLLGKSWLGASADWAKHDCATKSCDCFSSAFESPTATPTLQRLCLGNCYEYRTVRLCLVLSGVSCERCLIREKLGWWGVAAHYRCRSMARSQQSAKPMDRSGLPTS